MMHGGMMFFPWGMPFGGLWFLLIPLVVYIAIGISGRVAAHGSRRERSSRKTRGASLQNRILKLAFEKGGLLTVTDVAAEAGLSLKEAEKTLNDMVDFSHVSMRVSDSGVVVYEFVEIRNKDRLDARTLREMGI